MILARCIQKVFWLIGIISLFTAFFVSATHAEVVLDGTVGPKGAVSGPDYVITDKMGTQAGSNLFHSFQTFNINTGESGTFTGPNSVQNVIGRVTGGASSMIDGRLGCSIPGANLFLTNPYGMMFGPNATLDVNGSFHASTADYLSLGDTGRFDAVHPEQSILTVDPPSAFGFLDDTAAPIKEKSLSTLRCRTSSTPWSPCGNLFWTPSNSFPSAAKPGTPNRPAVSLLTAMRVFRPGRMSC